MKISVEEGEFIDLLQNAVFSEPTDEMVVVKDIEMFRWYFTMLARHNNIIICYLSTLLVLYF